MSSCAAIRCWRCSAAKRDLDEPLAGKRHAERLELTGRSARYHKIGYSAESLDRLLGDLF